jgi:aminopeptidase N/puromycin-sensitive aminopeptidase
LLLALFAVVSPFGLAQRLPQTVRPEHYTLSLTPDLKAATFTGQETIDVALLEPASAITLNAAEIKFLSVTTTVEGKAIPAKVTLDDEKQQATFDFGQKLPAGKRQLQIGYSGILNNELRGFYLSKTARRNYAVTQFESTDARRAFPGFDEPAFKATFDITLVVDKGDTAISNTNIVTDRPFNAGPVYVSGGLSGWRLSVPRRIERRSADPLVRHPGPGAIRGLRPQRCRVHPALLQHLFRYQIPNAEAGHDRSP